MADRNQQLSRRRSVKVYCYSQTGQLRDVTAAFIAPFQDAGWDVQWVEVIPRQQFPFPWPVARFFGLFPEAADPAGTVDLADLPSTSDAHTDLVIFAFQVWYLAPSLPMRTVLSAHRQVFAGCDVIGLVACRNMWYSAALEVRRLFDACGARYLGTLAATDTAPTLATIVTTLRWLLAGHQEAFWRFPPAGVGEDEMLRVGGLGHALSHALSAADLCSDGIARRVRDVLVRSNAAPVEMPIAAADLAARRAFRRWSRLIRLTSRHVPAARPLLLTMFAVWLGLAIVMGLPALAVLRLLGRARFDRIVGARIEPVLATAPQGMDR